MDLDDHLKTLESFSKSVGGRYHGVGAQSDGTPWSEAEAALPPWYSAARDAVEFLNRSGARVQVEELRDGAQGGILALRIRSFDADGLKAHLANLGSARRVAEWVEEGVSLGAVSVRGERIFLQVEPAHVGTSSIGSSLGERGLEATGVIAEAAQGVMMAEANATLDLLGQAQAGGGGELRQFRGDLPLEERQVMADAPSEGGGLARLRRRTSAPKTLATAQELGGAPRFVVTGPAVSLSDGTYYPVQAVDASSQRMLTRMGATGVKIGQGGQRLLVRADNTEPLPGGAAFDAPEARSEAGDGAGASRDDRVSLAYRLLHGLTLTAGEGAPLDASLADRMERFFGQSFSDVRVHTGRIASEVTEALSVEALSMGHHVVIPAQLLNSASGEGERVLVHELAHVRQHTRQDPEGRSRREADADRAVNRFLSGRGVSGAEDAAMAARPVAPPPMSSESMPAGVYASAKRMDKPKVRPKAAGPRNLREEQTIVRITREVSRQNLLERDDLYDRQG